MIRYLIPVIVLIISGSCIQSRSGHIQSPAANDASFAIIIDTESYNRAGEAVHAYRRMLESEGLRTYILAETWRDPLHVRNEIIGLHKADPTLEGAVFIGDIPVAMIRQGQHLTTAFKMNEDTFPRQRSSVPSDRFYDDFDLEFEYAGQDEDNAHWHYYRLLETSPQHISSDIYSGRIRPLNNGTDPYLQISDYLYKVVADRAKQNSLQHLFSFLGYFYNSGCMIAWASEKIALREQFPQLNIPGNTLKFMSYNMHEQIKYFLMNELQREELDVALLHKHGSIDVQHLTSELPVNSINDYVERIQRLIHDIHESDGSDSIKLARAERFGIPYLWYRTAENEPRTVAAVPREDHNLEVNEILGITPGARFIMLDACYNGSFNHDSYVAGAYIFNSGNTIVTTGNSVNVLQDNWPNQFMGLLASGVRLGHLRRPVNTMESHIIGDPTFRFHYSGEQDLNRFIGANRKDPEKWRIFLDSDNPDLLAYSLRMISQACPEGFSDMLLDIYRNSPWSTVRMECLHLLREINDENYYSALKMAVSDSYELIRRLGAAWMEDIGHADFLPYLVNMALSDPVYKRATDYVAVKALGIYPEELVMAEIDLQLKEKRFLVNPDQDSARLVTALRRYWDMAERQNLAVFDREALMQQRINGIRFLRNNNYYHNTGKYIGFAKDTTEDEELRVIMIEALGWFTHAWNKSQIIDACMELAGNPGESERIRNEALKTVRRLGEIMCRP